MTSRTKTGLEILQIALGIGILGDALLRQTPWGLNVLLFNLAFVGGLVFLLRRHAPERLTRTTYALLGAQIFFASMFVWRDSIQLRVADTFAIIVILGVLFLPTLKISARIAGVFQYAIAVVWAGLNSIFSAGVLFGSDIHWNEVSTTGWRKTALSVLRGLMIAMPLMIVFGALFMAADSVYEGWVRRVLNVDFENLIGHLMLFGIFGWLSAGYLRGMMFAGAMQAEARAVTSVTYPDASPAVDAEVSPLANVRAESGEHPVTLPNDATVVEHINVSDPPDPHAEPRAAAPDAALSIPAVPTPGKWSLAKIDNSVVPGVTLGAVEIVVILGLVNLLFLSFVTFQLPYLFGGMDLVQNTPDFKLAEYARRGFGELVAVAAIVLPMLLATHWLLKKESTAAHKLFRVLAGVQIALLFVIMASAVQRLFILTGPLGYGMTTVRLYPMIFMIWLAIVFVWFGLTVLRGARQYFAWGALWSAFFVLGATHVLNPDAFIVRTNIALMQQGREFDAEYNSRHLSDDAMPSLIESFESFNADDAQWVLRNLENRRCRPSGDGDLRSFNFSRREAGAVLSAVGLERLNEGDCVNKWYD